MFAFLISEQYQNILLFVGIAVTFIAAFLLFANAKRFLPRDAGREYAINGAKSKGKARGAGSTCTYLYRFSSFICRL